MTSEREQFLAERRKIIGATDISAIVGKSPYSRTAHDVYMEKLGLSKEIVPSIRMRMGVHNEPLIAALYAEQTRFRTEPGEFIHHEEPSGFIGGHPDFLVYNGDLNRGLECKYVAWLDPKKWGEAGTDVVPEGFFIQCQWYMMLTGLELWDLAVLDGGGNLRIYPVERHKPLINGLIERAVSFWTDHIEPKIPPPVDSSESASKMLRAVWPQHTEEVKEATPEIDSIASAERRAYFALKSAQGEHRGCANQIQAFMGDAGRLNTCVGRYLWRTTKDLEKVDWQKVCFDLFQCYAESERSAEYAADVFGKIQTDHTTIKPGHRRFTPPPKEKKDE